MTTLLIEPSHPPRLVDATWEEIKHLLGWVEITHPFEDDDIVILSDDDGIANGRRPNRTVNGCIIPGPFFIARLNSSDQVVDLTEEDIKLYAVMFAEPEEFGPGEWKITSYVEDRPEAHVIHMVSAWVPAASASLSTISSSSASPSDAKVNGSHDKEGDKG